MTVTLEQVCEFLKESDDFVILMHGNPDGDTLGCGMALCGALQQLGKRAMVRCPDHIPARFDYMRKAYAEQEFEPRTVIAVDVADPKLLGELRGLGEQTDLCIDHHESNTGYAKRTLLRGDYAAAAELVLEVVDALGAEITVPIANALYTGIATDTGCFRFSNTTPSSHIKAARLIGLGAEITPINYAMFDLKTPGRMRLEQEVLSKIRYYAGGHIAVIYTSLALLESICDIDSDDVGALAALPRQIQGVDIGISIKEKKNGVYKASLRSSERVNVSDIAQGFGGGGHARAAGCSFEGMTEAQAERHIVEACVQALEKEGIV